MNTLKPRQAKPTDAQGISDLINKNAATGSLLPRTLAQVMPRIRDFFVVEEGGSLLGVAALHTIAENLAEIRSLSVDDGAKGKGIGKSLVERCLEEAKRMGLPRVFVLTYQTEFFSKLGFDKVEKSTLPQKIWADCVHCARFSDCDETAMVLDLLKS